MYEGMTYEVLKERMLENVTLTDKREGSFVNDMLSPAAYEAERFYNQLDRALSIAFVDTSAGVYLDRHGEIDGLKRKTGTYAKGECTFTGNKGKEIPIGTLCGTVNGLLFEVTQAGIIDSNGSVTLPVQALEIGDQYNVLAGMVDVLPVGISGITGVKNEKGFLGGAEVETDDAFLGRILFHRQKPATSGNVYHYMEWAMEIDGVGDVRVFPLDYGPGTVVVMPVTNGKRSPDTEILERVAANIEEKRPIGATVTVEAPKEIFADIEASIQLAEGITLEKVQKEYFTLLESYLKSSVFRLSVVDYYKCLSMFYDITGVLSVKTFLLNGKMENISIGRKEIQAAGTVLLKEAVAWS